MIFTYGFTFVSFFLWKPFYFYSIEYIKNQFRRKTRQRTTATKGKTDSAAIPVLSLKDKIAKLNSYAIKRKSIKPLFIALNVIFPLLSVGILFLTEKFTNGLLASLVFYFIYTILTFVLCGKDFVRETKLLNNFLQFKRQTMGLTDSQNNVYSYQNEFTVLEWNDENNYPQKIRFSIPAGFDRENKVKFMEELSKRFGKNQYWYSSDEDWEDDNDVTVERKEFYKDPALTFIKNFLEMKKQLMGNVHSQSGIFTFEYEFEILELDKNEYPKKLKVFLPVGYDPNRQDEFLGKLSVQLGRGRPWEVDEISGGWDTNKQIAYIELLDPLPSKANWSAEYVTNPDVKWSFFPLGLGSKGGFEITNRETGKVERLNGIDVNGAQGKYIVKKLGLEDTPPDLLNAPQALGAGVTGGGKSVLLNNVEMACLLRPDDWLLMICDMKRVEGSRFMKFGVPVGVTYEGCAKILQFAQKIMMDRYDLMVKYGANDYDDLPKEVQSQALMVIVDEAAELLAPIKGSDDISKENAEYQAQALQAIESIYRLGRAAKVHCMTFAQRPSASDSGISMTIRQNSSTRIGCGRLPSTISPMVFEDGFGSQIPSSPKGRVGLSINNRQMILQGFYAPGDWLEKYRLEQGLPLNIYEGSVMQEEYEKMIAEDEFEEIEAAMSDEEFEELQNMLNS